MNTINPYGSYILQGLYANNGASTAVQSAQILDVPTTLRNLATSLILKGEVTQNRSDGSSVITTPRGDVNVRLQSPLPTGSRVDIQIPSGQSPKDAIIQPTLVKAVQQNQNAQQPQPQQQQAQSQPVQVQTQTVQSQIITDVKNLQSTVTQATQNITNTTSILTIGQAVRVTPLPIVAQQNFLTTATLTQPQPIVTAQSILRPSPLTPTLPLPQSSVPIINNAPITTSRPAPQLPITVSSAVFPANNIALPLSSASQTQGQISLITNAPALPRPVSLPISSITITPPQIPSQPIAIPLAQALPIGTISTPPTHNNNVIISTSRILPLPTQSDARVTVLQSPPVRINAPTPTPQGAHIQPTVTTPPPPSFSLTAPTTTAGNIVATVTGFVTDAGNPIIQTIGNNNQIQYATLNYPARNLPAGTQITLSPIPSSSNVTIPATAQPSWQAMNIFMDDMTQFLPSAVMQNIMSLLPNVTQPKSFPAAALLFLAAAKGGDLSGWLGNRTTKLMAETPQLSKKLIENVMRDISTKTGKTATPSDPPMVQSSPDWRGHILPLLVGGDIHQAIFWNKDSDNHSSQDPDKKSGTRFIVDLTLSRMGDIYFDGFINKDKKIFDMVVVSERELAKGMRDTIKTIWYKTLEGMNLDGNMDFKLKGTRDKHA